MSGILFKDVAHLYLGCMGLNHNGATIELTARNLLLFLSGQIDFKPYLNVISDEAFSDEQRNILYPFLDDADDALKVFKNTASMVYYLLKWRYDVYGLIETGQAIDATTLPVNPYKG